ncbi:MAG TPA: hypothetical protein VEA69_04130 [Tepidisphaeraceae bacterium]|nr:hypothetical protein [Tepidisphaeraceae bacterium]
MTNSPPTRAALEYAPAPSAGRRAARRVLRLWPAWLLLVLIAFGIGYGPGAWRHYRVMRMQDACMAVRMPTDRPVYDSDYWTAPKLAAAWPAEYQIDPWGAANRVDPRWAALAAELGVPVWPSPNPGPREFTVFCHERHTPDGRRRLVVVEGGRLIATVIEPGRWGDGWPRVISQEPVDDRGFRDVVNSALRLPNSFRNAGGVPDPADPSRFTATFETNGLVGTIEYRLTNEDTVVAQLLDPDGFAERGAALKAAWEAAEKMKRGR